LIKEFKNLFKNLKFFLLKQAPINIFIK